MNSWFSRMVFGSAAVVGLCVSAVAEPVSIWISSQQDKLYYDDMVKLYQEQVDADFEAEVQAFGFREMPDKLAVAFRTGVNAPDIVQLDEVFFGMYLQEDTPFVDLTDRVEKAGFKNDFMPQRLKLFSHQEKILGLPQSLSAMVIYYRRDLFEEYGLVPTMFSTWEGMMHYGGQLAEQGQAFLAMDPSYFGIFLRQRGGKLFDEDGNFLPDMELAADTLEKMTELTASGVGLMPDRASIFDPVFFGGDVENNEIMAIMGADWYGLDMIQQFSSHMAGQWGIMPLPIWEGDEAARRTSTFAGQGLVIYKGSKQVDRSWEFMKWVMTDREANARRFLRGNSFPAYKPSFEDPRLMEASAFFGGDSMGRLLTNLAYEVPEVAMNAKRPMAVFMMREGMLNGALMGEQTAEEALQALKGALENAGGPPQE
ncbi:MAG: extracellular solute-binding protein [Verrucomicrobiota bacterium]